jgi:hypothetical protein
MELKSPAFENESDIPSKYTCDGDNMSPPLEISNIPEGTKSLALMCDDPDAMGGDFIHWLVWNIDPATSSILEAELPNGAVLGKTDFGNQEYGGPCPPNGVHHYHFKLYALDTVVNLSEESTKNELLGAISEHILDQCSLVGLYVRG